MTDTRPRHADALPFPHITGYWVNRLAAAFRTEADRELRQFDLTRRQVGMLVQIERAGAPTASDLTRSLGVDSTAVTRMVDRLEEKGLVERSADPSDGRRIQIDLTAAARRLMPKLHTLARGIEGPFEKGISDEDLAAFHRVVLQMLENVDQAHFAIVSDD